MRLATTAVAALHAGAASAVALPDGIYSNEEQVCFEKGAERSPLSWLAMRAVKAP